MKGGNKIIFKGKPMRDCFSIKVIITTQATVLQKIQVPAYFTFCYQVLIPGECYFFEALLQRVLRSFTKELITFNMMK